MDASPHSLAALEAAVDLAARFQAELAGLFVEDENLQRVAGLPFVQEVGLFSATRRPIPLRTLKRGVEAALPVIQNGDRVLVFCERGRHRSVAMASCILIGHGYSAGEAMQLISSRRVVADPYAWHIQRQIRRFEAFWRARA